MNDRGGSASGAMTKESLGTIFLHKTTRPDWGFVRSSDSFFMNYIEIRVGVSVQFSFRKPLDRTGVLSDHPKGLVICFNMQT